MHNPLFQNILPEDIPVMLKRLHAYTKSYQRRSISGMPAIRQISSVLSSPVRSMYYRTITTATVILLLPSSRAPCSGRLLSVPGFLVFLWMSWLRRIALLCFKREKLLNTCDNGCKFHHTLIRNLLGIVAQNNMYLNQKIKYTSRKTTREN